MYELVVIAKLISILCSETNFIFVASLQMEAAMLLGLAALGYTLATQPIEKGSVQRERKIVPTETFVNPSESATDTVTVLQAPTVHEIWFRSLEHLKPSLCIQEQPMEF